MHKKTNCLVEPVREAEVRLLTLKQYYKNSSEEELDETMISCLFSITCYFTRNPIKLLPSLVPLNR